MAGRGKVVLAICYTLPGMNDAMPWRQLLLMPDELFGSLQIPKSPATLGQLDNDPVNTQLNETLTKFCSSFGSIWTTPKEQSGKEVQDVLPFEKFDLSSNYFSANYPLSMHQDYFYESDPPGLTFIWCIRNNEQAETFLVDLSFCFAQLSNSDQEVLESPSFAMSDYSSAPVWVTYPIRNPTNNKFRYDEDLIQPLTDDAERAWKNLTNTVKSNYQTLKLQPNEILIINNRACAHGRGNFSPDRRQSRRWLKRCLVSDL